MDPQEETEGYELCVGEYSLGLQLGKDVRMTHTFLQIIPLLMERL